MNEISVQELNRRLGDGEQLRLIDVREVDEYEYARIEGAELIPLSEFLSRFEKELKPEDDLVIYCHHGMRSAQACMFLEGKGFSKTTNVIGGIDAWSLQVDPNVPRY